MKALFTIIILQVFISPAFAGWEDIGRNARFLKKAEAWYLKKLNNMDTMYTTDEFSNEDTEDDVKFYSQLSIQDAYANLLFTAYNSKSRDKTLKRIKKFGGKKVAEIVKKDLEDIEKFKWDLEATRNDKLENKAESHAKSLIRKVTKKFNLQKTMVNKKQASKNKGA